MNEIITWANANQGSIMALLTLVYVAATIWLAWLARHQLQLAVELERSRTRPFVIFDLILERHFVFAVLQNSGQNPAYDVRITVTPLIQSLLGGEKTVPPQERSVDIAFISKGVAMLAPHREIKGLVGFWTRVKKAHPELSFSGTVSYRDRAGQKYSESFIADLSAHEGLLYLGTKDIQDVAKQLESISKTLDHISSGFRKPLIRVVNEKTHKAEEEAALEEALATLESQKDTGNAN